MTKSNSTQHDCERQSQEIRANIDSTVRFSANSLDMVSWDLSLLSSSVTTVGRLLHRHHTDDTFQIHQDDIEGLYINLEAMGRYIGSVSGTAERVCGELRCALKEQKEVD